MPDEQQIENQVRYSVQSEWQGAYHTQSFFRTWAGSYVFPLPSAYDHRRQAYLDQIDRHPQNGMWQGARSKLARRVGSTSYEIQGKRRVKYYQDIINSANKGKGFADFAEQLLRAYLVYDDGAVVELVGRGNPEKYLPRELITGINTLDPAKCFFTGLTDYPVIYQDAITGKLHKMHWSRVHRFVDSPLPDVTLNGRGESALSRAVSWVQQYIVTQTYIGESLDHNPPPGILLINGAIPKKWDQAWKMYKAALQAQGISQYAPIVEYKSDPGETVTIEFIPFSKAPDKFDPMQSYDAQARGIALALDIDVNDVWSQASTGISSGGEFKVLDKKGKEGMFAFLLKMLERFFNERVLPDPLKFTFQHRDSEKSIEEATIAQSHVAIAGSLSTLFPPEVVQRYLINAIPSLKAVALDENGEIIQRLYDDDPEPEQEQTVTDIDAEVSASDEDTQTADDDVELEEKDFEDTRFAFTRDLYRVMEEINGGFANRRADKRIIAGLLSKHGKSSYKDGMSDGGVEVEALEGSDLDTFNTWLNDQQQYIDGLLDRLYSGISEAAMRSSVEAWANKSLSLAYTEGLASADRDGLYVFKGDDGQESCSDCKRLKGKKFRLKDWVRSGYLPDDPATKLSCGGFQCQHYVEKTTGKAHSKRLIGL